MRLNDNQLGVLLSSMSDRTAVVRPAWVSPRKRRFCRWFLEAGWPPAEIAELFDLHLDELQEALA